MDLEIVLALLGAASGVVTAAALETARRVLRDRKRRARRVTSALRADAKRLVVEVEYADGRREEVLDRPAPAPSQVVERALRELDSAI